MKEMDGMHCDYSDFERKKRCKIDWAGLGLGDAFKRNLDYYQRLPALRLFYQMVKKVSRAVLRETGVSGESKFKANVKPQLGPCYTGYPANIAARAAIGHTAYLEFKSRIPEKILFSHMREYLESPSQFEELSTDPEIFKKVVNIITEYVQNRLLLEDLARIPSGSSVEIYRLFLASQQTTKFRSLPEILRAVILFGDILPDWHDQELHPATRSLLKNITETSSQFLEMLVQTTSKGLVELGFQWVRAIGRCIAAYLPNPKDHNNDQTRWDTLPGEDATYRFAEMVKEPSPSGEFDPLNGPNPPTLFDEANTSSQITKILENQILLQTAAEKSNSSENEKKPDPFKDILNSFSNAIRNASAQSSQWEDMRSDIVEEAHRLSGFNESPIQGNPADGHTVSIQFDKDLVASGEIFDRPIELSDDLHAYEQLLAESRPISEELKRSLYPNLSQIPEIDRFKSSGSLDPARLSIAELSAAVYRRYRIYEKADPRGRPVLVIACDGSGSLNTNQMKMVKILAAAWLNSTVKSDIQILAGLYHSGTIRRGLTGPLVQWIYHPQKTPSFSRKEAARALVALPDSGTGVQSDALSIAFILDEARRVAKGKMVYLILLSDCAWNRSFNTEKSGKDEVHAYFERAYEDFNKKLHVTLVALGVSGKTGFENFLDNVIAVSADELTDFSAVAKKIGVYVASCMRERLKWMSKS